MKMLLFLLLQVTFLTTLTQAFLVDIQMPEHVNPETTVHISCMFNRTYEQTNFVFIYNSELKLVYGHNYVANTGTPGDDYYKDKVSNPKAESGSYSIDFKMPYCYKDKLFYCYVYDWNMDLGTDLTNFVLYTPVPQPNVHIDGSCMTCTNDRIFYHLRKEAAGHVEIECWVEGVLPKATIIFPSTFTPVPGSNTSVEDPQTCTLTQTSAATATLSKSTGTVCFAKTRFGEEQSRDFVIVPYSGVELLLPAIMEESTTVTLNCTSDVSLGDPSVIAIWDTTYSTIYAFNFIFGEGQVGAGFEDMVSNPRTAKDDRWLAIDFRIPVDFGETALGCTFVPKVGSQVMDRRLLTRQYKVIN